MLLRGTSNYHECLCASQHGFEEHIAKLREIPEEIGKDTVTVRDFIKPLRRGPISMVIEDSK